MRSEICCLRQCLMQSLNFPHRFLHQRHEGGFARTGVPCINCRVKPSTLIRGAATATFNGIVAETMGGGTSDGCTTARWQKTMLVSNGERREPREDVSHGHMDEALGIANQVW